jgi:hypothetical protein
LSGSSYRSDCSDIPSAKQIPNSADGDKNRLIRNGNNSLLNGQYNENEAHEAFQQALNEWRTSSNKTGLASNKVKIVRENEAKTVNNFKNSARNAIINTDLTDSEKARLESIKNLENYITSNHKLSYAERMLLQKYRRNELELNAGYKSARSSESSAAENTDDKNLRDTINLG